MTEAEREMTDELAVVHKKLQLVNDLSLKAPRKCAAVAIEMLASGVKLFLDLGCGENVVFNENYTVQNAVHGLSFVNAFGLQGENNADCAYKIARTWVDKPIPQSVVTQLLKRLNEFYIMLRMVLNNALVMREKVFHIDNSKPTPKDTGNKIANPEKIFDDLYSPVLMSTQIEEFKKYLRGRIYANNTITSYTYWVERVFEEECENLNEFNSNINNICNMYDIGGCKESEGNKGHGSVINALKRYREFLTDKREYREFYGNVKTN